MDNTPFRGRQNSPVSRGGGQRDRAGRDGGQDESAGRGGEQDERDNSSAAPDERIRGAAKDSQAEVPAGRPRRETPKPQPTPAKPARKTTFMIGLAALVVLAACVFASWWFMRADANTAAMIDSSKYQAVSFVDGQLYFGNLSVVNDKYMKLTDIYYLQPQTEGAAGAGNVQKTTSDQNFKLVKFTEVIYEPQDEMIIPKRQILFFENLKPGGKVTQLIKQEQTAN